MNTSAKYEANWTETVGGVVWTRFCGQTDCLTAQLTDRLIPVYLPTNFVCRGIMTIINTLAMLRIELATPCSQVLYTTE